MRLPLLFAALSAVVLFSQPSFANDPCSADGASLASGTYEAELPAGSDIMRTFRVHVPTAYDAQNPLPLPLVLLFHGWGGNEDEFLRFKSVRARADEQGYIVVAPRGLGSDDPDFNNNSWSFPGSTSGLDGNEPPGPICGEGTPDYSYVSCGPVGEPGAIAQNTCSWTQCQWDDVEFALALVDHIKANLCVDELNTFASGGSNGGMFAWGLGQDERSAPVFRAIAPLIGLPHRGYLDPPGKFDDLPVLVITGTRDSVVPPGEWEDPSFTTTSNFSDLYYYTGATAITRSWADAHGCDITGDAIPFDDGVRRTDCRTYCGDDPGWPRVLDCRARMGHSYSLQWSWKLILSFFDAHLD